MWSVFCKWTIFSAVLEKMHPIIVNFVQLISKFKFNRCFFASSLDKGPIFCYNHRCADIAQLAEHVIGNDEVMSSNLIISSKRPSIRTAFFGADNIEIRKGGHMP